MTAGPMDTGPRDGYGTTFGADPIARARQLAAEHPDADDTVVLLAGVFALLDQLVGRTVEVETRFGSALDAVAPALDRLAPVLDGLARSKLGRALGLGAASS